MDNKDNSSIVRKNYVEKIRKKLSNYDNAKAEEINEMLYVLNFSFQTKNNFFIENFDKKTLNTIYSGYNQLKTNILNVEISDIFYNIDISSLKSFRFIISNLIQNFDMIKRHYNTTIDNNENTIFYNELWSTINLQLLKNCATLLKEKINQLQ